MPEIQVHSNNMPKKFEMREYQEDAIKYFIGSYESAVKKNRQI